MMRELCQEFYGLWFYYPRTEYELRQSLPLSVYREGTPSQTSQVSSKGWYTSPRQWVHQHQVGGTTVLEYLLARKGWGNPLLPGRTGCGTSHPREDRLRRRWYASCCFPQEHCLVVECRNIILQLMF